MKSSFPGKMERSLGSPMLTKLREIFSPERFFGDSIERNWSAIIAEAWSPAEKHTDVESLSQGAPVEETQSSQPWTVALNSLWDMRSPSKRHHEEVDDEDPIEMNSARSAHEADCLVVNFDRSSTCSALDAQLCSPAKRRDQRTRALSPGFGIDGEFSMHESGLHLSSSSHSAIMLPALDRFWEEYSPKSPGAPHESHQSDGEGDEVYEGESHIDQSVGSKKCFTDEQYWQMRSTRSEIATALSEGCGCRERCSDKLLNFDIVEAERHKMARVGSMERRSIVRADLAGFMVLDDDTGKAVFEYRTRKGHRCCRRTYLLQQGITESFLYRHQAGMQAGVVGDAPMGGARHAGVSSKSGISHDSVSPGILICCAWFDRLVELSDKAPNSSQVQIPRVEDSELYKDFFDDQLRCGMRAADIPSQQVWKKVWKCDYSFVRKREWMSVNTKDKIREALKCAIQEVPRSDRQTLDHLNELKRQYGEAIKGERKEYYKARSLAADFPESFETIITDGASQDIYKGINRVGFDSQHDNVRFKLVGTKVSARVIVIDIVAGALVADDANLVCTLLLLSIFRIQQERARLGLPRALPDSVRIQMDGVSSNWGTTTFAFIDYLVAIGVLFSCVLARHPVGSTHEDIDGLFGNIKLHLSNKRCGWKTLAELQQHILDALSGYPHRVIVNVVTDVLDFKGWFERNSAIDSRLARFSRHDDNIHPGAHFLRVTRGLTPGSTVSVFRTFQQPSFALPVLSAKDFSYWAEPGTVVPSPFKPVIVRISSEDEPASVLVRVPAGAPLLAQRKTNWEEALSRASRECNLDLPSDSESHVIARAYWTSLIGQPASDLGAATGWHLPTRVDDLWVLSQLEKVPWNHVPTAGGAAQANASAQNAPFRPQVASSLNQPSRAPSQRSPPTAVQVPLRPSSFAFVRVSPVPGADPFPLPFCLVQLPDVIAPDVDTTSPSCSLKVRWWKPSVGSGEVSYNCKWVVWFHEERARRCSQWASIENRLTIVLAEVPYHRNSKLTGPLDARWVRVTTEGVAAISAVSTTPPHPPPQAT